jgi:hypothetical protein
MGEDFHAFVVVSVPPGKYLSSTWNSSTTDSFYILSNILFTVIASFVAAESELLRTPFDELATKKCDQAGVFL